MKEIEFQLNSRGGIDNRLIREGDESSNRYKLDTKFTCRCGIIEDNPDKYSFIDPSGGPFIVPGYEIGGYKVKAIHRGGIIEFEIE